MHINYKIQKNNYTNACFLQQCFLMLEYFCEMYPLNMIFLFDKQENQFKTLRPDSYLKKEDFNGDRFY